MDSVPNNNRGENSGQNHYNATKNEMFRRRRRLTDRRIHLEVQFYRTIGELRRWFRAKGKSQTELYIGFYRKDCEKKAVTYAEALDEALCWGWIDGVRKKIDDESYTNRFTPRKTNSIWSLVNVNHVARLTAEGRMQPAAWPRSRPGNMIEQASTHLNSPASSLILVN